MENKNIKLEVNDWSHICGDGCCYAYGTEVIINDEKVTNGEFSDIESILADVLEKLGYTIERKI